MRPFLYFAVLVTASLSLAGCGVGMSMTYVPCTEQVLAQIKH
jgi:hypothetical protein